MRRTVISCTAWVLVAGLAPPSNAQVLQSSAGNIAVDTVARGLDHPWALAFLPDGRVLVTERPGRVRIVATDRMVSSLLAGVPKVFSSGTGWTTRSRPRSRLRAESDRLFLLCRAGSVAVRAPRSPAPGLWMKARPGSTMSR